MKNQHQKIKGYRDLSQQEIDLMNRIKEHGEQTAKLIDDLSRMQIESSEKPGGISKAQMMDAVDAVRLAEQHLKTGHMWLTRAVALPNHF